MIDIDNIVEIVLNDLSKEDIAHLKKCKKEFGRYGIEYHFTLGLQIRNRFNLWSYGDADDISATIIDRLIRKVKGEP